MLVQSSVTTAPTHQVSVSYDNHAGHVRKYCMDLYNQTISMEFEQFRTMQIPTALSRLSTFNISLLDLNNTITDIQSEWDPDTKLCCWLWQLSFHSGLLSFSALIMSSMTGIMITKSWVTDSIDQRSTTALATFQESSSQQALSVIASNQFALNSTIEARTVPHTFSKTASILLFAAAVSYQRLQRLDDHIRRHRHRKQQHPSLHVLTTVLISNMNFGPYQQPDLHEYWTSSQQLIWYHQPDECR